MDTAVVTDFIKNTTVEEAVQSFNPLLSDDLTQTEKVELQEIACITIMPEYTVCIILVL